MTNEDYKSDIKTGPETIEYINENRIKKVSDLALHPAKGVDMQFALDQIQGWQTARKKLPSWASKDGIIYPPHLNMEQCSSEQTARYKAKLCARLTKGIPKEETALVDLTGGLGVDFAFMSQRFHHAVYVEKNERLCAIARHNFKVLGLENIEVVCEDGVHYLKTMSQDVSGRSHTLIYIDPARRDINGNKVFGIKDCTPDVVALKDELISKATEVIIKLSPMLDWHAATKSFGDCCKEVHIVSVDNECKELLTILEGKHKYQTKIVCVNNDKRFECKADDNPAIRFSDKVKAAFLYVPNASIMKAGVFAQLTEAFPVSMVDKNSHLFLSDDDIDGFPGRKFTILTTTSMNKRELKENLKDITYANISTRNFPMSVAELRKRLKLKDGGDTFLFATTARGTHIIYVTRLSDCQKLTAVNAVDCNQAN